MFKKFKNLLLVHYDENPFRVTIDLIRCGSDAAQWMVSWSEESYCSPGPQEDPRQRRHKEPRLPARHQVEGGVELMWSWHFTNFKAGQSFSRQQLHGSHQVDQSG